MTNTDVAVPVKFEDRVKDLLRENFGKMLTDEELMKIMSRGIEELLFNPRPPLTNYHNSPQQPPLIHELLLVEFKPIMTELMKQWCADNHELIEKTMNEVLGTNAAQLMANSFNLMLQGPFMEFRNQLNQALMNSNGRSVY